MKHSNKQELREGDEVMIMVNVTKYPHLQKFQNQVGKITYISRYSDSVMVTTRFGDVGLTLSEIEPLTQNIGTTL